MNGTRENLALSEDGEPVVQVRNVVLCYIFVRVDWLVTLRKQLNEQIEANLRRAWLSDHTLRRRRKW